MLTEVVTVTRLIIAFGLGSIIGWEREKRE